VKDLSTGASFVQGRSRGRLYEWPLDNPSSSSQPKCNVAASLDLWHRRLGHPTRRTLDLFLNKFSIPVKQDSLSICNSCQSNKSHRQSFSTNSLQSHMPLQIIYSDLWGPSPILSVDRKRYYVLFVDQFSKYMWLHTIQSKHKVLDAFKTLHPLLECRFRTKYYLFISTGKVNFSVSLLI